MGEATLTEVLQAVFYVLGDEIGAEYGGMHMWSMWVHAALEHPVACAP